MSRLQALFSVLMGSLLLTLALPALAAEGETETTTTTSTTQTANGPVTVEKKVIVTHVPAAKEVIETPTGFISCTTIDAAWVNDNWVPEHRVCKYDNSPKGVSWVDGYWSCVQYKADSGDCTNWKWVAAHWEKTYSGY